MIARMFVGRSILFCSVLFTSLTMLQVCGPVNFVVTILHVRGSVNVVGQ